MGNLSMETSNNLIATFNVNYKDGEFEMNFTLYPTTKLVFDEEESFGWCRKRISDESEEHQKLHKCKYIVFKKVQLIAYSIMVGAVLDSYRRDCNQFYLENVDGKWELKKIGVGELSEEEKESYKWYLKAFQDALELKGTEEIHDYIEL